MLGGLCFWGSGYGIWSLFRRRLGFIWRSSSTLLCLYLASIMAMGQQSPVSSPTSPVYSNYKTKHSSSKVPQVYTQHSTNPPYYHTQVLAQPPAPYNSSIAHTPPNDHEKNKNSPNPLFLFLGLVCRRRWGCFRVSGLRGLCGGSGELTGLGGFVWRVFLGWGGRRGMGCCCRRWRGFILGGRFRWRGVICGRMRLWILGGCVSQGYN